MQKSQQPVQGAPVFSCPFPVAHEQGECPCFDDWGECPDCGSLLHSSCAEDASEFVPDPDPEEEAAYAAWAEELLREGEEAGKVIIPLLKSITSEEFASFAGPCPDTATLVAYQESGFLSSDRHVLFCRCCLEDIVSLGRADEVEYKYSI